MQQKMPFNEKIAFWAFRKNFLIAGLDITKAHIPKEFQPHLEEKDPETRHINFICHIADLTSENCCGWKPNLKFYEGSKGRIRLEKVCEYIRIKYPDHILIGDNKDGDIGNTNKEAMGYYTEELKLDAITVNPLMGYEDSAEAYLSKQNIGVFALCLTSNKGAQEFLKTEMGNSHHPALYKVIASKKNKGLQGHWDKNYNYHLVVGATNPSEDIRTIRKWAGENAIFLMPGFGAQGGNPKEAIEAAKNKEGIGFLAVVARNIVQPEIKPGEEFDQAVQRQTKYWCNIFAELSGK